MKSVTAHLLNGGVLWGLKGKDGLFSDIHVSVQLGNEQASHWPFLKPNLHTSFRPDRVAIETADSQVVQERFDPRESFKGHVLETPWDDLQLAYLAGYAMWTYLNTPFLFCTARHTVRGNPPLAGKRRGLAAVESRVSPEYSQSQHRTNLLLRPKRPFKAPRL